jgi:hypothetical protein
MLLLRGRLNRLRSKAAVKEGFLHTQVIESLFIGVVCR